MIAPDGSPIEVYERLPDRGDGELVEAALPPPATLLELGCGTGRVTRQLVARGPGQARPTLRRPQRSQAMRLVRRRSIERRELVTRQGP